MKLQFKLNTKELQFDCEPHESLMDLLRRERIWSVKHGCETGECGACSVLLDGKLTPTCVLLAGQAEGLSVTTVEGLPKAFLTRFSATCAEYGAIQCGYCTPGIAVMVAWLEAGGSEMDDVPITKLLEGNLCRCTGYQQLIEAVKALR